VGQHGASHRRSVTAAAPSGNTADSDNTAPVQAHATQQQGAQGAHAAVAAVQQGGDQAAATTIRPTAQAPSTRVALPASYTQSEQVSFRRASPPHASGDTAGADALSVMQARDSPA